MPGAQMVDYGTLEVKFTAGFEMLPGSGPFIDPVCRIRKDLGSCRAILWDLESDSTIWRNRRS